MASTEAENLIPEETATVTLQVAILLATMYRTLDEDAQQHVIKQVQSQLQSKSYDNLSEKFYIQASYENRDALTAACQRCDVKLASWKFQLATFQLLDNDEKTLIAQDLYYAYFIYCSQYALDQAEGRTVNYNSVAPQLNQCVLLLSALRNVSLTNFPSYLYKYLVIASVPILNTCLFNITAGNTMTMLSDFNVLRFFWIWSSSAIDSVLALLNRRDSRELLSWPSPVSGHISYSLYALRGGFELAKGVKHVVLPTDAENRIGWWTRLKQQASQRKFRVINDGIWGPANAACFYWLVNSLSAYNAGLTVLLLLMDSAVAYWDYSEQKARYDAIIGRITEEKSKESDNLSGNGSIAQELDQELEVLQKKKDQALELLQYTVCYALLLTLGCAILVSPGGLPCLVVGSFVCMILSLTYEGLSASKKIEHAETDFADTNALLAKLTKEFEEYDINSDQSKLTFNHIKYLEATIVDQKAQIAYQRFNLHRTMLTKALVPPFILICLLLLPFGWPAVGGMIAVMMLALAVNLMINQIYPPPAPTTGMKYSVEALSSGQDVPALTDEEYPRKIYVSLQENALNIYFYNAAGKLITHELSDNVIPNNILTLSLENNQPLSENIKQMIFESAVRSGYDFYFNVSGYNEYLLEHNPNVGNVAEEYKEEPVHTAS